MSRQPHRIASWEGAGSCYDAGGKSDGVRLDGSFHSILKLSGATGVDAAERPAHVGVSFSYRWNGVDWAGTADVVGVLRWSSGRGTTEAEVDISSWGTQISLTGGADMLEVGCYATGDAVLPGDNGGPRPLVLTVSALVSVGDTSHIAAQRTVEHIMPTDADVLRRIPSYAHALYFTTTNFSNLSQALCEISADNNAASPTIVQLLRVLPNPANRIGQRILIPIGAHYFRFSRSGGVWQPARLRTIFELAL